LKKKKNYQSPGGLRIERLLCVNIFRREPAISKLDWNFTANVSYYQANATATALG